jgi:hypothetical protein
MNGVDGLGPDARTAFRYPFLVIGLLAGIAGALDAIVFAAYGVFTANQAGNLVLVWVHLLDETSIAALSAASIVGSALGISLVVAVRIRATRRGRTPALKAPLIAAFFVLAQAGAVSGLVTAALWERLLFVAISAFGLGLLGASVMLFDGRPTTVIGSTGAFISSVRLLVVHAGTTGAPWRAVWTVAVIPVSWSAGAAVAALTQPPWWATTIGIAVAFILILLSLRRVETQSSQ